MNIVLMHGVLGFGRRLGVDYFNGVAERLSRFPDAHVLTTVVPPIGKVPVRAARAASQIAHPPAELGFEPDKPIHIIAHSMGGLDARWIISHDLMGLQKRIETLICLGTPHLGSPIASIIKPTDPFHVLQFVHIDNAIVDELRSNTDAVEDLAEGRDEQFDRECPDIKSVHYFNVAGVGRDTLVPTSAPFVPLHAIVAHAARGNDARNDGVVSFPSATRRREAAAIWHADHADMVGHDLNKGAQGRPAIDYLAAYDWFVTNFILQQPSAPPKASGLV
jgi:triacylglycerol lipase